MSESGTRRSADENEERREISIPKETRTRKKKKTEGIPVTNHGDADYVTMEPTE